MCTAILSISLLGGLFESVLFRSALHLIWQFKSVQMWQPRLAIERLGRLAAMLFDDPAPGDSSGYLLVGEVTHLNEEVAHYEVVQGG